MEKKEYKDKINLFCILTPVTGLCLTVANIIASESDGKHNSEAAVDERSSTSLTLCGEYIQFLLCTP